MQAVAAAQELERKRVPMRFHRRALALSRSRVLVARLRASHWFQEVREVVLIARRLALIVRRGSFVAFQLGPKQWTKANGTSAYRVSATQVFRPAVPTIYHVRSSDFPIVTHLPASSAPAVKCMCQKLEQLALHSAPIGLRLKGGCFALRSVSWRITRVRW